MPLFWGNSKLHSPTGGSMLVWVMLVCIQSFGRMEEAMQEVGVQRPVTPAHSGRHQAFPVKHTSLLYRHCAVMYCLAM